MADDADIWALAESDRFRFLSRGGSLQLAINEALHGHYAGSGVAAHTVWTSCEPYVPGVWPHGSVADGLRVYGPRGYAVVKRWGHVGRR